MGIHKTTVLQGFHLALMYCLPALIILGLMMYAYHDRAIKVGDFIDKQRRAVETAYQELSNHGKNDVSGAALREHSVLAETLASEDPKLSVKKRIISHYIEALLHQATTDEQALVSRENIDATIDKIWASNAMVIVIMSLSPFLLLGGRFAYSGSIPLSYKERRDVANNGWWMKFVIALIVVYGWIYILNPNGRGAGTIEQFLIAVDLSQTDTLPMFLRGLNITPILAGFLGWYLYMLTYFFSKMANNDVASSQVYGTMLQKFLFTWGVIIVFVTVKGDAGADDLIGANANLISFVLGFFPMAAFSLIKDKGLSMVQGYDKKRDQGSLTELPSISRWQILRLEEEGIDSIGALAYHPGENIRKYLPGMSKLVDYWADIARLYAIVGAENYDKIKPYCVTGSEFVRLTTVERFRETLAEQGVHNSIEVARILERTFPDLESQRQGADGLTTDGR